MTQIRPLHREKLSAIELRARARESAGEFHKLLVSLSVGAVVVYFYALTTGAEPPLSKVQQTTCLVSLIFMVVSVLGGILSWYADAKLNLLFADILQSSEYDGYTTAQVESMKKAYGIWGRIEMVGTILLLGSFVFGIIVSVGYVTLRIFAV